jgi:hypothetical protein
MLSIAMAAIVVGALTFLLTRRLDKSAPFQLAEPRPSMLMVGIQIICGDCSGEQETPRRTFLGRNGRCEQCSGNSYVLASRLVAPATIARTPWFGNRRVLPFDTPAIRAARKPKIAV